MNSPEYVSLNIRKIPFDFPNDMNTQWIPEKPELCAMINGASLTMPFLEPFLIKSINDTLDKIEDPQLKKEVKGFVGQEAHHFKMHRKFNDLLIKKHPQLKEIEEEMRHSYSKLSKKSLQVRMAYTAGFEAMTMGITKWLVGDRVALFAGADPRATSFVLWHMVEETEHKRVAHDAYAAVFGHGFKSYLFRALGVFHGSFDVMRFSRRGYISTLKRDGLWKSWQSRLKLAKSLFSFLANAMPFLLRAALPGHDPRAEVDLQWVIDWLKAYNQLPAGTVPLVDTNDPEMPVPYLYDIQEQTV